jgi:hypothetical protein
MIANTPLRCRLYFSLCAWLALGLSGFAVRADDRSMNGSDNNPNDSSMGAANTQLGRISDAAYGDLVSSPAGGTRPSAREISNTVSAQTGSVLDPNYLSDFVWQWGQFLDHDMDLTEAATPSESFHIPVPAGDPYFDPNWTGTQEISLNRSVYHPLSGTGTEYPREQMNSLSSWIDASNVYGSDDARAAALRAPGGKLATSAGNLLPFNTGGLPNANEGPLPASSMFVAGDVRANEQIGLTAMHTLFMREHNRIADSLEGSGLTDDQIYHRARKIVGAQMQVITYNEFLPALLGEMAPVPSATYDSSVDATISIEFTTAIYRVGHTMLSPQLQRIQNDGTSAPGGAIALSSAFFDPTLLDDPGELDLLLKGLASQRQQMVDTLVVDGVRNFLFGPPGSGGFDLASLNIQRGRDHGLSDYNSMRVAMGLDAALDFSDITSDAALAAALSDLYEGDINNVDLWVGALAEDLLPGASVGELTAFTLADQFQRLADGDHYFYLWDPDFTEEDIAELEATRLSDIILRNTDITNLQSNVFIVPEPATWMLALIGAILLGLTARGRCIRFGSSRSGCHAMQTS